MKIIAYAKYRWRLTKRFFFPKRIRNYKLIRDFVRGKQGIEIGGPSKVFNDIMKIYSVASKIDGVNFSSDTIWQGKISAGAPYNYEQQQLGTQFINDATDLNTIADASYDFLVSSHCLEHVANPIRALKEWCRVIRNGGMMVLVLPDPEHTFDHRRERTTFEHILSDYENNVTEEDQTHVQDVIDNCDLSRVYLIGGKGATIPVEQHIAYAKDNSRLRTVHHHVYTDEVVHRMLETAGFGPVVTEHFEPFHMIYITHKIP